MGESYLHLLGDHFVGFSELPHLEKENSIITVPIKSEAPIKESINEDFKIIIIFIACAYCLSHNLSCIINLF